MTLLDMSLVSGGTNKAPEARRKQTSLDMRDVEALFLSYIVRTHRSH